MALGGFRPGFVYPDTMDMDMDMDTETLSAFPMLYQHNSFGATSDGILPLQTHFPGLALSASMSEPYAAYPLDTNANLPPLSLHHAPGMENAIEGTAQPMPLLHSVTNPTAFGRRRPNQRLWEEHKDTIIQVYKDEGCSLKDTRQYMIDKHQFEASIRAYREKFADWDIQKNLSAGVAHILKAFATQRKFKLGKKTKFRSGREVIDIPRIDRTIKRAKQSQGPPVTEEPITLPPGITHFTPAPSRTNSRCSSVTPRRSIRADSRDTVTSSSKTALSTEDPEPTTGPAGSCGAQRSPAPVAPPHSISPLAGTEDVWTDAEDESETQRPPRSPAQGLTWAWHRLKDQNDCSKCVETYLESIIRAPEASGDSSALLQALVLMVDLDEARDGRASDLWLGKTEGTVNEQLKGPGKIEDTQRFAVLFALIGRLAIHGRAEQARQLFSRLIGAEEGLFRETSDEFILALVCVGKIIQDAGSWEMSKQFFGQALSLLHSKRHKNCPETTYLWDIFDDEEVQNPEWDKCIPMTRKTGRCPMLAQTLEILTSEVSVQALDAFLDGYYGWSHFWESND